MIQVFLAVVLAAPSDAPPPAKVVRLAVGPMAAPKPALKYQLLPEVRELKPGNPVQWYLRSFAEQRNFFFAKESVAERARYQTMPLADLPADKLRNYGGSALTQTDWGARLDTPDWQVLDRVQTEGTDLVMPELAALRVLGAALQVRFRGEVARKDFDAAVGTAKTMLALARHLGENPTPDANRLGLTVADLALDTLQEMIQQPGSPNLYWALTDLPAPLVELRKGFQGWRAMVDAELRLIRDDAMTDAQLDELVGRLSGRTGFAREQAGRPPRNLRTELAARAKDADGVRSARARLVEAGAAEDRVAKVPALQVVLLDEKREYEVWRDEELKRIGLPLHEMPANASRGDGLFADLLPSVADARRAQGRLEQRVAVLRHVEALRMRAAGQDGAPLPTDPATGKPFAAERNGDVVRITVGAGKGERPAVRYEITIRK